MSSTSRSLFAGALVLATVGIAYWAFTQNPDEPAAPVVAAPVQAPAQQPAPNPGVWVSPQARNAAPPAGFEEPHDHAAEQRELIAANEAAWSKEPASPQKAAEIEDKFRVAVSSEGVASLRFKPSSVSVQCRAGMCRVESEFPRAGTSGEWATRMQLVLGGDVVKGSVVIPQPLPDGSEKLLMYAYLPGRRPPG